MTFDEGAGLEALDHASFARSAVTDQDDLEQIVEALVVARTRHQVVGVATRHSRQDDEDDDRD